MTVGEENALRAIEKVWPYTTDEKRMKKLGEEIIELAMALQKGDEKHIREEIGDVAFVLIHILSKYDSQKLGIIHYITMAQIKMEQRLQDGYYKHITNL